MDLRDRFASSFAQALVTQGVLLSSSELAARAYDLAEAMLLERERRIAADELAAREDEELGWEDGDEEHGPASLHLLDDAEPLEDDDDARAAWLEARALDEVDEAPTSRPARTGPGLVKARDPQAGTAGGERTG